MESVYLLLGPETGEKNAFIDKLREDLAKRLGGPADEEKYYVQDMKPGALASLLLNGSLFAAHRVVQYSGIELIGAKADAAALAEYAKSPSPEVTLILLSDEVGVEKSIKDAVGEKGCKIFWEMFENRKEEWVRSFFRKEGFRVSAEAVDAILDLIENNTEALKTECSRLALFLPKDREIDGEAVERYLSHDRSENAFSLFDRVAAGEFKEALESLEKILFSKEGEPIGIMAGLLWSFKRLENYETLLGQGFRPDEASIRSGIKSKKLQSTYADASRRYPLKDCRDVISRIMETDSALRSSGGNLAKTQMQKFLYETMVKSGKPIEAWESLYS